jgi:ketosteroid isomerase-like protein
MHDRVRSNTTEGHQVADDAVLNDPVADRIRAALESADMTAIAAMLDADVTWGAPDDEAPACRNRREVLAWYQRGRDAGVRAHVTEVIVHGDRVLVGLLVTGRSDVAEGGGEEPRWQVLSLAGDRVIDIRGFDDRDEAAARAGVAT